jgi:hypothetical protein
MPAFLAAIPAFLKALPELIRVLLKFMLFVEKIGTSKWLADCEATIDQLDSAKTPEQKREAARSMVDLIRKLG